MFFFLIFVLKFQLIFSFSFETAKNLHLFGFQNELSESELSFVELPRIRSKRFVDDFATIHFPVLLENETIVFQLKHKVLALDHVDSDECVLQGQSIRPNNSFSIALTGCGKDTQGLILTDKHFYVIRPSNFFNLINVTSDRSHVIQKRSTNQEVYSKCGVDHSDDPHPEDLIHHHISEEFAAVHKYSDLNIELGLFVDDAMWNFFIRFYGDDAEKQIKRFVIAAVNNIDILFSRSTMDPKVHLRITHFEIMKTSPMAMSRHHHNSGDVTKLLETFCTFQAGLNPVDDKDPKHWDHALLLTGYDIYRGNEKTVAGFAPVKGMCVDLKSCTVNEGLDFGTVFVIAHEMGHSLG
uniref:Peptidase M12B domain-containing protein n=1 Tax=Panagrolaimus sp. JU765 TaxID=591449 RepID=A0AC34QVW8_9BILA